VLSVHPENAAMNAAVRASVSNFAVHAGHWKFIGNYLRVVPGPFLVDASLSLI
jgi:hypothetical protein